jgi:hypothetical protein
MEGCAELGWLATPKFVNAILYRTVRGAILEILNKINLADFFKSTTKLKVL